MNCKIQEEALLGLLEEDRFLEEGFLEEDQVTLGSPKRWSAEPAGS